MVAQSRISEPRQNEKGIPMEGKPDVGSQILSTVKKSSPFAERRFRFSQRELQIQKRRKLEKTL